GRPVYYRRRIEDAAPARTRRQSPHGGMVSAAAARQRSGRKAVALLALVDDPADNATSSGADAAKRHQEIPNDATPRADHGPVRRAAGRLLPARAAPGAAADTAGHRRRGCAQGCRAGADATGLD